MTHKTIHYSAIKPGQHFVTTTKGMRGWFAVEMWSNDTDFAGTSFWEPWQSDDCSYLTQEEAEVRAIQVAAEGELCYLMPTAEKL